MKIEIGVGAAQRLVEGNSTKIWANFILLEGLYGFTRNILVDKGFKSRGAGRPIFAIITLLV